MTATTAIMQFPSWKFNDTTHEMDDQNGWWALLLLWHLRSPPSPRRRGPKGFNYSCLITLELNSNSPETLASRISKRNPPETDRNPPDHATPPNRESENHHPTPKKMVDAGRIYPGLGRIKGTKLDRSRRRLIIMTRLCGGKIHFRLIIQLSTRVRRSGLKVIRWPVISIINVPSEVLAHRTFNRVCVLRPRVLSFAGHRKKGCEEEKSRARKPDSRYFTALGTCPANVKVQFGYSTMG